MFEIDWINLFNSILVTLWFLYCGVPLIWMIIYEYRYYYGAGEDYYYYGKEYVKKKFILISNGKLPIKK
jgi:hypothetical protein